MRCDVSKLVVLALLAAGCHAPQARSAPEGARSVVRQPVGPIPGAGALPPAKNPLEDQPDALMEGRRLFVQMNCSGCHGGHGGGGMGPSLRDPDWLYGGSPDRIFNSIAEGRGKGMPAWGVRLTDKQIWELTLYVSALRTSHEPEPPR
jgi:cytochrome c oxidase cbb3-type subunit 3